MNERDVDDCRQSLLRIVRDYPAVKASGWAQPVRSQIRGSKGSYANPTEAVIVDGHEKRNADGTATYVPGFLGRCRTAAREADRQVLIARGALYAASRCLERALNAEPEHEYRSPPLTPDDPDDPAGGWRVSRAERDIALMAQARRVAPFSTDHLGVISRVKEKVTVTCSCGSSSQVVSGDAPQAIGAWVQHVSDATGEPVRMIDYGLGS